MFNGGLDMGVRSQEMWELMTKTLWVPMEDLERIVSVENRASRRKSREVSG